MDEGSGLRSVVNNLMRVCEKCGEKTLPDPRPDELTVTACGRCGARYIRLHYAIYYERTEAQWKRLKWWQRV